MDFSAGTVEQSVQDDLIGHELLVVSPTRASEIVHILCSVYHRRGPK